MKQTLPFALGLCMSLATGNALAEERFDFVASEAQILRVNSDAGQGDYDFKLLLDEENSNVVGFRLYSVDGVQNFVLDDLPTGIVILHRDDHDVAILKSNDFNPEKGGKGTLVYLYNGLNNTYKQFEFEIQRENNAWHLQVVEQEGPRKFEHMFMKAKKVVNRIVGIESITVD